jgi:hypothetical protein
MTPNDQGTTQPVRRPHVRRHIELPDGTTLIPRTEFAGILGENERTTRRRNLPTTYIGNVAYIDRDAGLKIIGDSVRRSNQPTPPTVRRTARSPTTRSASRSHYHGRRHHGQG